MERKDIKIVGKFWTEQLDYGLYYKPLIEVCAKVGLYQSADEVWDALLELDGDSRAGGWFYEFGLYPNTNTVLSIIKDEDNFILFGNWILIYDLKSEAFEELDNLDLVPYYGYNYKYSEFLKKDFKS